MDGYCREEIEGANRSSGTILPTSLCKGKVMFECIEKRRKEGWGRRFLDRLSSLGMWMRRGKEG